MEIMAEAGRGADDGVGRTGGGTWSAEEMGPMSGTPGRNSKKLLANLELEICTFS